MHCSTCASPIPDGGRFCMNCGADVVDASASTPGALDPAAGAALARLLRQETAGEYEIEREIGRGGMGAVYLANEIHLRRRVAIKVLPPSLTVGDAGIERFRREARTAAALDHPNIIPIYRVSAGGSLMWYSMKLLEGRSLEHLLDEHHQLELDETVAILAQVADALDYAHQRGVIHRDVKPANIMLDERRRVTVTDFGIAKEVRDSPRSTSGSVVGTPRYMAPEQYLGGEISGAADQYSLAVVAYQCLGRRAPFDAPSLHELLHQHVTEPPPPLSGARSGLPAHAYGAIDRALAKNPADRFATVSEFVAALAGRITMVMASRSQTRRGSRVARAGVVAATAAVVLTGLLFVGDAANDAQNVSPAANGSAVEGGPSTSVPPAPSEPPAIANRDASESTVVAPALAKTPAPTPTAVLVIRITGGWARIYVNGDLRGERPVHREELPPGTHRLRFERAGYSPVDTALTLQAGRHVIDIAMRPTGR